MPTKKDTTKSTKQKSKIILVKRPAKGECIDARTRTLLNKQLGYDGEAIAVDALQRWKGLKAVKNNTAHKGPLDVLTARNAYEVKAMNLSKMHYTKKGLYSQQVKIGPKQRATKLAQAAELKRKPGVIVVVFDDVHGTGRAEVFIRDGVHGYRLSTMTPLGTYEKNWRKTTGYSIKKRDYDVKVMLEENYVKDWYGFNPAAPGQNLIASYADKLSKWQFESMGYKNIKVGAYNDPFSLVGKARNGKEIAIVSKVVKEGAMPAKFTIGKAQLNKLESWVAAKKGRSWDIAAILQKRNGSVELLHEVGRNSVKFSTMVKTHSLSAKEIPVLVSALEQKVKTKIATKTVVGKTFVTSISQVRVSPKFAIGLEHWKKATTLPDLQNQLAKVTGYAKIELAESVKVSEKVQGLLLGRDRVMDYFPVPKKKALELMNEVGVEFTAITNKFPGLRKLMSDVNKRYSDPKIVLYNSKGLLHLATGAKPYGAHLGKTGTIEIITQRPYKLTDRVLTIGAQEHTRNVYWKAPKAPKAVSFKPTWAVGDDFLSIFRHEYGHHLFESVNFQQAQFEWKLICVNMQAQIKNKVSVYAATNAHETFAEAFCAYTSPNYGKIVKGKKQVLPEVMEKFLDKWLK